MPVTEHFTLKELCKSENAVRLGLANVPLDSSLANLHFTAAGMERVRALLNFPIKILSGYRSPAVNEAAGGSKNSQHMKGEAVDFVCPAFGTPLDVCRALEPNMKVLGIDQLIYEGGWVHASFTLKPRYEVLTKKSGAYVPGIVA